MNDAIRSWGCVAALALALLGTSACSTSPERPRQEISEEYRGFRPDFSAIENQADLGAIRAAMREQIDMVCAVGVTPEVLEFFQHIPLRVVPEDPLPALNPGAYAGENHTVKLTASILTVGHKPVLLHEFLHAFHQQKIPGGFNNQAVLRYYERAQALNVFAPRSHMMDNVKEYFACCATTYLFGVTGQEPFRRDKVRSIQPQFYEFLQSLFGPSAGQYAGSLERS